MSLRVAVVGAGWAGLAAAVRAVQAGHEVSLFEMAPSPGGRARSVERENPPSEAGPETDQWQAQGQRHSADPKTPADNGQHILIGAYVRCLDLMRSVGVQPDAVLYRQALRLQFADGFALAVPSGLPPAVAFGLGVLRTTAWPWLARLGLLKASLGWALRGFTCPPSWTVAHLCQGLPAPVLERLVEPLCVAALNTPAHEASASVFLRVLRDALFSGPGSADLLLPKADLGQLLPQASVQWLQSHGAQVHVPCRVLGLNGNALAGAASGNRWQLKTSHGTWQGDAVILACTAKQAAQLVQNCNVKVWAEQAASLRYEPIITAYIHAPGGRLPSPMTALLEGPHAPAQFAFDLGSLSADSDHRHVFSFVVSGAAPWVERGLPTSGEALLVQARSVLGDTTGPLKLLAIRAEKRATFRCTPELVRPPMHITPGLMAAGDYVQGPYPATLEGAVRSGEAAAAALHDLTQGPDR